MFLESLPSFSDELLKLAASSKVVADEHFKQPVKNWPAFEESMKKPAFRKAVKAHPDADQKIKMYINNYGGYVGSKKVVAKVKSRTDPKKVYEIRKLPSGRLGCGCKDWQFKHSVKGTNCDHIEMSRSMKKISSPITSGVLRGMGVMNNFEKQKKTLAEGNKAQSNVVRIRMGLALIR